MDEDTRISQLYRQFADYQAHGSSPTLEAWACAVADDPRLRQQLATLPAPKRQPNLVFAALQWHGAEPGDETSLRRGLSKAWDTVRTTILHRSTQTNEAARCAVLLPLLHSIGGPIALIELGAAAGLCLIPDLYSYHYSDGTRVEPATGSSDVLIECQVAAGKLPLGLTMPQIVWRAGIDLNPLDPADRDTAAWLATLVWPEHEQRRQRLGAALRIAADSSVRIDRADMRDPERIQDLVARVPHGATPVVLHSATLAYLNDDERSTVADTIDNTQARWISFEGRGVIDTTLPVEQSLSPDSLFVAALDRVPLALANGHGDTMSLLDGQRRQPAPARRVLLAPVGRERANRAPALPGDLRKRLPRD